MMSDVIRVLYVDDEPNLLVIGKLFLEESGNFMVTSSQSASEAIRLIEQESFDAIVSDYQMPGMDGLKFLEHVRLRYGTIPFILFTGRGREEVVIKAINHGVDFYLQKGGNPEAQFAELILKIRQAVQRHKAETDLAKSEANLQAIIANTNDIIASYDPEVRLLVYNQAASETYRSIFGIELHPGLCTLDLFPESMRGFWNANNERALAGESFSIEFNLPMTSGQERFFESSFNPIRKDGVGVGFSTFTRDITERKRAETELRAAYEQISATEEELRGQLDMLVKNEKDLRESEERYRLISENTADVIWTLNYKTGKFTYVSPSVQKLRGYTTEEVRTQTIAEALTPESMETVNRLIQEGIAKRKPGDTSHHITTNLIDQPCKDGSVVSTEVVSTLVFDEQGNPVEIFGISRDITERKRAETALLHQSATLSILNGIISTANKADNLPQLLNSILDESLHMLDFDAGGIYLVDRSTRIANVVHSKNLPEEFLAEIQPLPIDKKPYDTLFIKTEPIITENYAQIAPDRSKKYGFVSMASIPLLSKGVVIGALNVASKRRQVISEEEKQTLISISRELGSTIERMAAEEEVRRSAKNLETLFNSIDEMVFVLDMQGNILAVNDTVQKRLSYTSEELIGTNVLQLHVPERRDEALIIVQGMIAGTIDSCPVPVFAKDGSRIEVETKVTRGWWNGNEALIGVSRDITERKVAEERLHAEHELVVALASKDLLTDVLPLCLATAIHLSGMDSGGIYLVSETTGDIELTFSSGLYDEFVKETSHIRADSDSARLVLTGRPIYSQHLMLGVPLTGARAQEKLRAIAVIPILSKERVIACFNIASHTRDTVPEESRIILESIAALIGNGIARFVAEEATRTSEERYRALFEGAAEGILVADIATEKFLYANTAISRMLQYSKEELTAMGLKDIHPVKDIDFVRKEFQALAHGDKKLATDIPCLKKDKTVLYAEIVTSTIVIDNRLCNVGFFTDITGRRLTEDTLRRVNQKLNIISHLTRNDITNQIFVLSSYLDLTKNQLAGQDRIIETLQKGVRSIQSIHETIEYSKDYQDMGAKPPIWQNLKMAMLFGLSHISLGKIQHSLETENLEIFADPLLEKVCQRLFENSVKHGDHVTRIRIWHTVTPDGATIFFEDDGIGIPHEKKEQIFLRSEGPNTSMRSLIFVGEILDITGIKIRETGEPGKGVRFEIMVQKGGYRFCKEP